MFSRCSQHTHARDTTQRRARAQAFFLCQKRGARSTIDFPALEPPLVWLRSQARSAGWTLWMDPHRPGAAGERRSNRMLRLAVLAAAISSASAATGGADNGRAITPPQVSAARAGAAARRPPPAAADDRALCALSLRAGGTGTSGTARYRRRSSRATSRCWRTAAAPS